MKERLFTDPCPNNEPCFYCEVMRVRLVLDGIGPQEARRMAIVRNHLGPNWPA